MSEVLERKRLAQKAWRERNPTYYAEKMRERKARDPEGYAAQVRKIALRTSYGITVDDYDRMFKMQRGRCAICGTTDPGQGKKNLCVDHCHKTKVVRGLLCHTCNRALGLLSDSVKVLEKAATYLKGELTWQRRK
jgi:hypothetical protein